MKMVSSVFLCFVVSIATLSASLPPIHHVIACKKPLGSQQHLDDPRVSVFALLRTDCCGFGCDCEKAIACRYYWVW